MEGVKFENVRQVEDLYENLIELLSIFQEKFKWEV
jgi:hypothetical protein